MFINYKSLSLLFFTILMNGCSSTSVQLVEKPDINANLNINESIIQLKRADYFVASLNNSQVFVNEKFIGELANDDEIVWKTKANSLECILLKAEKTFVVALDKMFEANDTPIPYKCFSTKPKEVLKLLFDFQYAENMFRGFPALTIYRQTPLYEVDTSFALNIVNSDIITKYLENGYDLTSKIEENFYAKFGENISAEASMNVNLEILEYKGGNAAKRWVRVSNSSSTYLKVKVIVLKSGIIEETFVTKLVVANGGLLSVGADDYIFEDLAQDVYYHLFGKIKNKNEMKVN